MVKQLVKRRTGFDSLYAKQNNQQIQITNMKDNEKTINVRKIIDDIILNDPNLKCYSGNFIAFLDSLSYKGFDRTQYDYNLGRYFVDVSKQFYKSIEIKHKILNKVTDFNTHIELVINFDKSVPFFVHHEDLIDFETFLNDNYPEVYNFLEHNKNETNKKKLISFQFLACAANSENIVYKPLKQSRVRKVTNLEELLLLYNAYMNSLFVHKNYESELKNLILVIKHKNNINLKLEV